MAITVIYNKTAVRYSSYDAYLQHAKVGETMGLWWEQMQRLYMRAENER